MTTLRTRLIAGMAGASRTAVTKHNKEQRRLGNYEPGESADGATAELIKMAAALDALAAILDAEGWLLCRWRRRKCCIAVQTALNASERP